MAPLTGKDAPTPGAIYAINILGTDKVLARDGKEVALRRYNASGDPAQHWECTINKGHLGFRNISHYEGAQQFLGYWDNGQIVCRTTVQDNWENFEPRIQENGGFALWQRDKNNMTQLNPTSEADGKLFVGDSNIIFVAFTKV